VPVLVTAADSPLGVRVVRRLLATGGEVRAYCRGVGPGELRAAGAVVATGDLDDEGKLEAAMAQAHTVLHLAGGLASDTAERVAFETDVVATAAVQAGVQRLIALSLPGADPAADEPLRRAKGMAEAALRTASLPTVVVRTSLVDTPTLRDLLAGRTLSPALQRRPVAPLRAEDLVEALVELDAVRSEAHEGHVVLHADGPTTMPLQDYLDRVGVSGSRVGRRYRPAGSAPLVTAAIDGPWVNGGDPRFDLWRFTGLRPAPVVA
jgi:uncharacterized protein YbjT (DUF2867 family)